VGNVIFKLIPIVHVDTNFPGKFRFLKKVTRK